MLFTHDRIVDFVLNTDALEIVCHLLRVFLLVRNTEPQQKVKIFSVFGLFLLKQSMQVIFSLVVEFIIVFHNFCIDLR